MKWTFCARFSILLLESVIALVCIWLQFKANHSKNVTAIEQNEVKWTFCARFVILFLESVIALVCFWLQFKANHSRMWRQLNRIKWNEHFVQESFKNMMAIEQNKVKWTFCAIFAILLLESMIALVCIWLQLKANHSRMWRQLNRIKWNEHFVQDLLFCYWKVLFHWCVFGCNSKQIIQECDGNWAE